MKESDIQAIGIAFLASLFIFLCRPQNQPSAAIHIATAHAQVKLAPADDDETLSTMRAFTD